jgi:N-acetylglucosamine kinase-like BadF-type ATPase
MGHVLGVDGGGSATRCVIMSTGGEVLATSKAGPSNPITIGAEKALANILGAIDAASARCGVHEFLASWLGIAGTDKSRLRQELIDGMRGSFGDTVIASDAASALAGGTGCRSGVVVIAGTGSIAYGENRLGETARAGGWGWRLGDEGSGYTIGLKAIMAALKSQDGRGPETLLKRKIVARLGLDSIDGIIDWVYEPGREPRDIAYLVPIVREAEAVGDDAAALVMAKAGAELGLVANAVIRRLGLTGGFPVSLNGGVFKQPSGYIIAFEEVVRREAPECALIKPRMPPLLGSGLLALKSIGVAIDEALLMSVEKSYMGLGEADD